MYRHTQVQTPIHRYRHTLIGTNTYTQIQTHTQENVTHATTYLSMVVNWQLASEFAVVQSVGSWSFSWQLVS